MSIDNTFILHGHAAIYDLANKLPREAQNRLIGKFSLLLKEEINLLSPSDKEYFTNEYLDDDGEVENRIAQHWSDIGQIKKMINSESQLLEEKMQSIGQVRLAELDAHKASIVCLENTIADLKEDLAKEIHAVNLLTSCIEPSIEEAYEQKLFNIFGHFTCDLATTTR